jgi:hypothetical protein
VQFHDQLRQAIAQFGFEQPLDRVGIERLVLFEVGVHGPAHPVKLRGENREPFARFLPVTGGKRHDYMDILAIQQTDPSAEIVAAIAARAEGYLGHCRALRMASVNRHVTTHVTLRLTER